MSNKQLPVKIPGPEMCNMNVGALLFAIHIVVEILRYIGKQKKH